MSVLAEDNIPVVKQSGAYSTKKPIKLVTSANVQTWVINGTGSPAGTVTAPKGSLYLRTDGSTTNDRAYINTDSSTTWTALTTAA